MRDCGLDDYIHILMMDYDKILVTTTLKSYDPLTRTCLVRNDNNQDVTINLTINLVTQILKLPYIGEPRVVDLRPKPTSSRIIETQHIGDVHVIKEIEYTHIVVICKVLNRHIEVS